LREKLQIVSGKIAMNFITIKPGYRTTRVNTSIDALKKTDTKSSSLMLFDLHTIPV